MNGRCDQATVSIDVGQIVSEGPADAIENNFRKTMCHELGHSYSIDHYSKNAVPPGVELDCMIRGVVNNNAAWLVLGNHDIAHVNDAFA